MQLTFLKFSEYPFILRLFQNRDAYLKYLMGVVIYPIRIKSISYKKGAKKDCCTKFPENLPMSKRKQNNTKHVPIPISNKYMKNLKINCV